MAYALKINNEMGLVTVNYDQTTSYDDRVDLLSELKTILTAQPTLKILIDVRNATQPLSPQQELQYGELLAENYHYFRSSKVAIVSGVKNPHAIIQAGAYADGFRHMVEFQSTSEALDWLAGSIR